MPAPSAQLWRRFLTNTRVSFVENDAKCAQKYKSEIEKVARGKLYVGGCPLPLPYKFVFLYHLCPLPPCSRAVATTRVRGVNRLTASAGDQEDAAVLNQIVEDAKAFSGFDIIVDDGSHKAGKMLASLRVRCRPLRSPTWAACKLLVSLRERAGPTGFLPEAGVLHASRSRTGTEPMPRVGGFSKHTGALCGNRLAAHELVTERLVQDGASCWPGRLATLTSRRLPSAGAVAEPEDGGHLRSGGHQRELHREALPGQGHLHRVHEERDRHRAVPVRSRAACMHACMHVRMLTRPSATPAPVHALGSTPASSFQCGGLCVRLIVELPCCKVLTPCMCCTPRRMKPMYMGPDSPVRREFIDFCASNPMDSESRPQPAPTVAGMQSVLGREQCPSTPWQGGPSWSKHAQSHAVEQQPPGQQLTVHACVPAQSSAWSACRRPACW